MPITHTNLRNDFDKYWEGVPRSHNSVKPAPLVLKNDPSTLFTGSGMQQLIPFLMGKKHDLGKRLFPIIANFCPKYGNRIKNNTTKTRQARFRLS